MTSIFDTDLGKNAANYVLLSPVSFVERSAEVFGDLTAVIHGQRRYTWRQTRVMKGYLKTPTAKAFEGGWFHTGDLAVMEPDRYVKIKDRSKDIIISGGENISSLEVEDALYRHAAVMTCAVVAKADAKWGETPVAFVELKPGAEVSAAALIAHCRDLLAAYKLPRDVRFEEIPKTSTGKIQKFALRERVKGSA